MKRIIVTKEILDFHDEYDGDFGLLSDTRYASEEDRQKLDQFSDEQVLLFEEYVDKLHLMTCTTPYLDEMRAKAVGRLGELEEVIDPEVADILKRRIWGGAEKPRRASTWLTLLRSLIGGTRQE